MLRRLLWLVLALPAAGCGAPERGSVEPNLVLVSLDTVRADALGAWGNPQGTTPHLDRIARRGATFAHTVAQAASTLPSHRSMFRSRTASRSLGPEPMLAELLSAAGWNTVAFTGGGNISGELGFSAGFDVWEEEDSGLAWAIPRFRKWLARRPSGPFFAFLHTYDAHLPYDPPFPWNERFDLAYEGPLDGAETRPLCRTLRGLPVGEEWSGRTELTSADRRHIRALYDGGVAGLDRMVGELVELLVEEDLEKTTTLVFMSDHGEEFWDHGSLIHSHTVFAELVHVPLVVAIPGESPAVLGGTVRNVDIAPTLLELAGLEAAPSHVGESLIGPIQGGADRHRPAISEMKTLKALVEWPWKLVTNEDGGDTALFRLDLDPGETHDLSAELAPLAERLAAALAGQGGDVGELSHDEMSSELEERLRALGYLE